MKTLLLLLLLQLLACSTPYARQWESRLWLTSENKNQDMQELGSLETEDLLITVVCTQFRQVLNPRNSLLAISAECRNESNATYPLHFNPIQVLTDENVIVQPLPLDHVMYTFYGGDLRTAAQTARLWQPYEDYSDTAVGSILTGIVNAYRAYENQAIINEFKRKEALPHALYYRSFTSSSLPPGGAVQWNQYYPVTVKPIKVMIEGNTIESALKFEKPPPKPPPQRVKSAEQRAVALVLILMIVGGFWIMVQVLAD